MADLAHAFAVAPPPQGWRMETAMARVLAMRMDQIARWGHTPEDDLRLPQVALPEQARVYVIAAIEDLQFAGRTHKGREKALHNLERAGALILAAIDRLMAETAQERAAMIEPTERQSQ